MDDNRSSCEIIAKILSLRSYDVDVAYNGSDALELIRERDYGLALIDYRMPGMDGVELIGKFASCGPARGCVRDWIPHN